MKQPVIDVKNISVVLGGHTIHQNISWHIESGFIYGLLGSSGSGKSVLLKTIIGLLPYQKGTISYFGHNKAAMPEQEWFEIQQQWGVMFQEGALFSSLNVLENIIFPLREYTSLPLSFMKELGYAKLALVHLEPEVAKKMPNELSGGMKKRVALARALILEPQLLFLDEPTAGLDPLGADRFDDLIENLHEALNLTVVMITHDLDTIHHLCSHLAVLVDQKIISGTLKEVVSTDHPWIKEYFLGTRGKDKFKHLVE